MNICDGTTYNMLNKTQDNDVIGTKITHTVKEHTVRYIQSFILTNAFKVSGWPHIADAGNDIVCVLLGEEPC